MPWWHRVNQKSHTFCLKLKSFSQHTLLGYSEKVRTHRLWGVRSLLYSGNSKFFLRSSSGQLTTPRHLVPNLRMGEAVLAVPRNASIVTKETTLVLQINIYTGCPRRNVPDFGRVFLMLKYTDITQNTYVQSWTVTGIMAREVWNFDSCYTFIDYQIHIKTGRNMWSL